MVTYGGNRPTVKDDEVLTAQDFNDATRFWVTDELPDTGKDGDVVFVVGDEPSGGGINVESQRKHQLLQGDDAKGWVPGMAMSVVDALPADDAEGYAIGDVVFVTGPGDGGSSTSTAAPGLVHLRTLTFSNESSVSVDNIFTDTFDNYRLMLRMVGASNDDVDVHLMLRNAGNDQNGATTYQTEIVNGSNSTVTALVSGVTTAAVIGFTSNFNEKFHAGVTELFGPHQGLPTLIVNQSQDYTSTVQYAQFRTGYHNQSVSCDGFTLEPTEGTLSGVVSVYGYSKGSA